MTGQERSSAPAGDSFKNGGRPESHGGTVHQAPSVAVNTLSPEVRSALESVSETTVTAQQYGNLASMRHASGVVHDLGDRMVVTNSRINKVIAAALPGARDEEKMSDRERSTFDALARTGNEREFGVSVAQWVVERYPATISALERVAGTASLQDLSGRVSELKSQLADAQKMLQGAAAPADATGSVASENPGKSD